MKKRGFFRLVGALVLALLLGGCIAPGGEREAPEGIVFPAYQVENPDNLSLIDEINATAPFRLTGDFPDSWRFSNSKGEETVPAGEFYSPVYLYEGESLIGYAGFNRFTPYAGEIAPEQYHQTVWPTLRLSSIFQWDPFTSVKTTDQGEVGVVKISYLDPDEIEKHPGALADVPALETMGILLYNREQGVYVGIAFLPDTVTRAEAEQLARSIALAPVE